MQWAFSRQLVQVRLLLGSRQPAHPQRLFRLQIHPHQGLPTPGHSLHLGLRSLLLRGLTSSCCHSTSSPRGLKTRHSWGTSAFQQLFLLHPFFFFFLPFGVIPEAYGSSWAKEGSNQSCSCQLTPQPQQHQIRATSVTYTAACGTRSLIH